jgi:hypothetical protein
MFGETYSKMTVMVETCGDSFITITIVIVIKVMLCSRRVYYVQLHTRQLTWMEILKQNKFGICFGNLQASCLLLSKL